MSDDNTGGSCAKSCGIKGAIAGLVFALIFYIIADFTLIKSLFWGVVIAVLVALLLWYFVCGKTQTAKTSMRDAGLTDRRATAGTDTGGGVSKPSMPATEAPTSQEEAPKVSTNVETVESPSEIAEVAASAPTPSASTPTKAFEIQPSKALSGEAELADRKGNWKYEAPEASASAPQTEAAAPSAAQIVASTSTDEPVAAKKAPAKKKPAAKPKATKPKRAAVAADGQPEVLTGPRAGQSADDLKLISGVGPKLEQTLNELGFYHFDQVAGWRKKEIEWVDSRLRFKGRIERDDWISQAKILAKGGETEFSKRKKK